MYSLLKDGNPEHNNLVSPILTNIFNYIMNVSEINNLTDSNIENILKKQRADESNNRLRQFQRKNEEEQALHKMYRTHNLGRQMVDDEDLLEVDTSDVDFMTVEEGDDTPQVNENIDDIDMVDTGITEENESLNLSDNILLEGIEDREEAE